MHIQDHLLVLAFAVLLPLYGFLSDSKARRERLYIDPSGRLRTYIVILVMEWALTLWAVWHWTHQTRGLESLGLTLTGTWFHWASLAACVVLVPLLFFSQRNVYRDAAQRENVRAMMQRVAPFLPQTWREFPLFAALCVTAGVCEEVLYRGFFLWYLMHFTGETAIGASAAVTIGAAIFGLAHAYQGPRGMIKVFVIGLVAGALYLLTGSLLVPIILHIVLDINGGWLSVKVHENRLAQPGQPHNSETEAAPAESTATT